MKQNSRKPKQGQIPPTLGSSQDLFTVSLIRQKILQNTFIRPKNTDIFFFIMLSVSGLKTTTIENYTFSVLIIFIQNFKNVFPRV